MRYSRKLRSRSIGPRLQQPNVDELLAQIIRKITRVIAVVSLCLKVIQAKIAMASCRKTFWTKMARKRERVMLLLVRRDRRRRCLRVWMRYRNCSKYSTNSSLEIKTRQSRRQKITNRSITKTNTISRIYLDSIFWSISMSKSSLCPLKIHGASQIQLSMNPMTI